MALLNNIQCTHINLDTNFASSIHDVVTSEVGEAEDLARLRLL